MSSDPPTDPETTVWASRSYSLGGKAVHFDPDCSYIGEHCSTKELGDLTDGDGEFISRRRWCKYCTEEAGTGRYTADECHVRLEDMDADDLPV